MSLLLRAKARKILAEHEDWLRKELEGWPHHSCFDTCATIEEDIRKAFPSYDFRTREGYFYDPERQEYCHGHMWLQAHDGTIIDPTAGQFLGGHPLRVFEPDDPATELYLLNVLHDDEAIKDFR
jgi:hypothetical protein